MIMYGSYNKFNYRLKKKKKKKKKNLQDSFNMALSWLVLHMSHIGQHLHAH